MIKGFVYKYDMSSFRDIRGIKIVDISNNVIFRLKNNCMFMCIKTSEKDDIFCKIAYINNGGSLCEGYVKLENKTKFIKMQSQLCYFKVIPKRRELEILLSMENKESYNSCISRIVNYKIKEVEKKEEDYKKLYNYWKNICYSNEDHIKLQMGDNYINISYDYKKIKDSKSKIHKELIRNFKLYR
jgi:hypothetical protein